MAGQVRSLDAFAREKNALQYLGRHAGRKRKRAAVQEMPTLPSSERQLVTSNLFTPTITSLDYREQDDVTSLLALLCSLNTRKNARLPRDVLFLGFAPQQRWNRFGNIDKVTVRDAGLTESISRLFANRDKLENTVTDCIRSGSIIEWISGTGPPCYSLSPQSNDHIKESYSPESMHLIHIEYIAYIFPRMRSSGAVFQDTRKALLPYLDSSWDIVKQEPHIKLPLHIRTNLVEASLAAYKLVDAARKSSCMLILDRLHEPELPLYVQFAIVAQKSASLRLQGYHHQSDKLLDKSLNRSIDGLGDIRSLCARWRLLLSQAENAILRRDFRQVMECTSVYESPIPPSALQVEVSRLQQTLVARLNRYRGDFKLAKTGLELCLKLPLNEPSRYYVLHHLGDVLCENGSPQIAIQCMKGEVDRLRSQGKEHSKALRRAMLPLAEAYIMKWTGKDSPIAIAEGEDVAKALLRTFERIKNLDVSDQLSHVRSMITLARVYWYRGEQDLTRAALKKSLDLTKKYPTFSEECCYTGFIYMFLSAVEFRLQLFEEGNISLTLANEILRTQMPQHFMPGLGSYFLSQLLGASNPPKWPWSPITQLHLSSISP
ncbi:hypothetical protein DL95DRAFT_415430 [Leptodontidium sp. 2 PMI_412]|nr:hypothetical protein DL95DRAFT_415430 [Leptodontidium sp. 2 PMI_412]